MKKLVFVALLLLVPCVVFAQQAPLIQQSPSLLDAIAGYQNASGTTQQTATIPANGNQCIYVVAMEVISTATTAPAASALTHTTTNLYGMKLFGALTATAGVQDKAQFYPSKPVKSPSCGTAVTIVSNAAVTSVTYNINVWYFYGP